MTSGGIDTKAAHVSGEISATEGNMTYNHLILAAVIRLLEEGRVEIVQIEFSLNREFVVCVKDTECERRLRSLERRGVPAHSQELTIVLDPFCRFCTSAELYVDVVNPVDVDYKNDLRCRA